ncbi:MAG: pilin [Gammaproteobacteria bacterium]|nr:pilin [Gammaproteobacteria bacterium]
MAQLVHLATMPMLTASANAGPGAQPDTVREQNDVSSSIFHNIPEESVMNKQKGFTLIELMIVVAIIAILAAIALPAYQNYVAKSQTTAGLADVRGGVTAFEEGIQSGERGAGVPTNADIGLAASTPRCSAINVTGNWNAASGQRIECVIIGNPSVVGSFVRLTRDAQGQWLCTATATDVNHRPNGC